jgi:excisionase family DNA binding protein
MNSVKTEEFQPLTDYYALYYYLNEEEIRKAKKLAKKLGLSLSEPEEIMQYLKEHIDDMEGETLENPEMEFIEETNMPEILTVKQVASFLQVTEEYIRRIIRDKKLKAFKLGKDYRVQKSDLNQYIAECYLEAD